MKRIPITSELLAKFHRIGEALIMEGYCRYFADTEVYCDGDSYATVATGFNGGINICLLNETERFIDEILSLVNGKVEFCGVSPYATNYVKSKYEPLWETNCDLYVYDGKPLPEIGDCDMRSMDVGYAQQISNGTHYHAPTDEIAQCIKLHPSSAAYVNNKPVCWCLVHLEGSLGMLYTLPQYRRQGYALKVMTHLCRQVINRGGVPFAYIVQDNVASKSLAVKYNLREVGKANYFEISLGG